MMDLGQEYWSKRYENKDTTWDAGKITTPIKEYAEQLKDKKSNILIPGCGNAHEAEYLFANGFTNVYVVDISHVPLKAFHEKNPDFPESHLLCNDFFQLEGQYDLILEQTFFCAIDPSLRSEYARKAASLLKTGGKLAGVLFDDKLNSDKPPFGGSREEYISYFRPYFEIKYMDRCYNSIPPRAGRELFIVLLKIQ